MGDIPEPPGAAMAVPEPPPCLALRVFYLRVSRCEVDESMLNTLTLTHTPLTPDTTILDVSGAGHHQPSLSKNGKGGSVCLPLRGDRVGRRSSEATFVCAATVRVSGSVRFEVQSKHERLMVGILETCDVEGSDGSGRRSWVMKCQAATLRGSGLLKCPADDGDAKPPLLEVYVAGVSGRGTPVVFTKAMQLRFRCRRRQAKAFMDPIPECGELEPEESGYRCYKPDPDADDNYDVGLYTRAAGLDEGEEYSELSWFTAGVRVGVGISLGICLGVGIGAGLLVRSYQSTSRALNLKRRLFSNLL
ncbi:hypothetical protein BS78_01G428700 [Paspalum vaginatum]|nr:hypothetical protein BS78_01G428700 [Paspalum vaginatum]KAJ1298114.1 hypothetical protein BS78_01G428700 [Paspalum vaginatum]